MSVFAKAEQKIVTKKQPVHTCTYCHIWELSPQQRTPINYLDIQSAAPRLPPSTECSACPVLISSPFFEFVQLMKQSGQL